MARLSRSETFSSDEIATVHVMNRVVRRCFLLGQDALTGKDYGHRKGWIEDELERVAAYFGIDLLNFAVLCNHFHLMLRSRPDVVKTWNDREVARRWRMLCPKRKRRDGTPRLPTKQEINSLACDEAQVKAIRARLSDISWWMRLVCQHIAQRANKEDGQSGKFWQSRFRAVRLLDEQAILAGAAYVDLNPIRAAIAQSLESSEHTSLERRMNMFRAQLATTCDEAAPIQDRPKPCDAFLAPVEIDELHDELGPRPSQSPGRCSDKGFLAMPVAAYLALLDWTARQFLPDKGSTPVDAPPILERLSIKPQVWHQLVGRFGAMFSVVAGTPEHIDSFRSLKRKRRFNIPHETRQLLA